MYSADVKAFQVITSTWKLARSIGYPGVKENGTDRHRAGSGVIEIDESVIEEYLALRGLPGLTKGKYATVKLDNEPAKEISKELENRKPSEGFDESRRFKEISDLMDAELNDLIDYYEG